MIKTRKGSWCTSVKSPKMTTRFRPMMAGEVQLTDPRTTQLPPEHCAFRKGLPANQKRAREKKKIPGQTISYRVPGVLAAFRVLVRGGFCSHGHKISGGRDAAHAPCHSAAVRVSLSLITRTKIRIMRRIGNLAAVALVVVVVVVSSDDVDAGTLLYGTGGGGSDSGVVPTGSVLPYPSCPLSDIPDAVTQKEKDMNCSPGHERYPSRRRRAIRARRTCDKSPQRCRSRASQSARPMRIRGARRECSWSARLRAARTPRILTEGGQKHA